MPKIELEGAALKRANKLVIVAEDCFAIGQMRIPMAETTIGEKDIYVYMSSLKVHIVFSRPKTLLAKYHRLRGNAPQSQFDEN